MTSDEQQIRNLVATWISATKTGDTATVLGLMSDDVVFMTPGQPPFGKEVFAQAGEKMRGVTFDGTQEIVELTVLGDWAFMRGRLRVAMTPPGGQTITRSGYTLTILRKNEQGKWQIARDANMLSVESS